MFDSQFQIRKINENLEKNLNNKFSILFVYQSEYSLIINDINYYIIDSTLILLAPGDFFTLRISRNSKAPAAEFYKIDFDSQWLERVSDEGINLLECFLHKQISRLPCISLNNVQYNHVKQEIEGIYALFSGEQDLYGNVLESKLKTAELLISINKAYRENNSFNLENKALVINDAVQRVSDYMRTNYWDDISIEMLSVMFKINRNQLCRQFKELTGVSPIRFLINYRLSCACGFLNQGFSVEETCSKVGFSNLPHFSKSFKNRYGMCPSQYRSQKEINRSLVSPTFCARLKELRYTYHSNC